MTSRSEIRCFYCGGIIHTPPHVVNERTYHPPTKMPGGSVGGCAELDQWAAPHLPKVNRDQLVIE